jgi:hypothetical protein
MNESRAAWADRLRTIAGPSLVGTPITAAAGSVLPEAVQTFIDQFRDDSGNRRPVDRPLLASMLGMKPARPPSSTLDVELWWDLARSERQALGKLRPDRGPLLPTSPAEPLGWDGADGIEVWSEAELSALHALSHLALADATLLPRLNSAASWLIENVQPDNATNRPWAIHVFLDRWISKGDMEANMYAQTLLHNCRVSMGRPDRFSACILWDAATWLSRGEALLSPA